MRLICDPLFRPAVLLVPMQQPWGVAQQRLRLHPDQVVLLLCRQARRSGAGLPKFPKIG